MNGILAIRRLIYLYFFLLIVEGALRFWVFPGLSSPLLIVRDPVVVAIYLLAAGAGLFPMNAAVVLTILLATASGLFSFMSESTNLSITLFGLRANFLHLPLVFVMQRVLGGDEVIRIGKWCLFLMIPMAILTVKQFKSPPGSLINAGGYPTWYGSVRPAGTFSFVSGMVAFSSMVAAFLAHSLTVRTRGIPWWLKIGCAVAVVASLAVSGSRATVAAVAVIFVMLLGLSLFSSAAARGVIVLLGVIALAFAGLSTTEFFDEGKSQLQTRFIQASQGSSVVDDAQGRLSGIFTAPFYAANMVPFFGYGVGLGTNAGAYLATGRHTFLGYETEWGRCVFEMGPLIGGAFILLRLGITLYLFKVGWAAFKRGSILSLLLFGATAMNFAFGQWGVPTNQGFASFVAGLCLAAYKLSVKKKVLKPVVKAAPLAERQFPTPFELDPGRLS